MADDAGALLVRSGLVSSSALDDARSRVASLGGTLGEQLVASGTVSDDALTDFYKSRLLVPQVNPNTLARLPAKVVSVIPSDMAIELRAIPVSLDNDNNLTVAMSDPSDRHAVDEIAFFTGTYVVRAVATQMQIAWCLAHYYGHVTHLGQRLLQPDPKAQTSQRSLDAAVRPGPRPRGMTGKVEAERHKAMAPVVPEPAPAPKPRPRRGGIELRTPAPPPLQDPAAATVEQEQPRAKSISGEIRVPSRRAPSIRPDVDDGESGPVISIEAEDSDDAAVITMEADSSMPITEDPTAPAKRPAPPRRARPAEPDPPELAARAGEIGAKTGPDRKVDDEPRVVIEMLDEAAVVSGEIKVNQSESVRPDKPMPGLDDNTDSIVIHEQGLRDSESQPILLDRRRPSDQPPNIPTPIEDPSEVVVLDSRKTTPQQAAIRSERITQLGVGVLGATRRAKHDTETQDGDPTTLDMRAAPPSEDYDVSDEQIAAPPSPYGDDDTSPVAAPPGQHAMPPGASGHIRLDGVKQRAPSPSDDDEEETLGKATAVMTAVELDEAIPERKSDVFPAYLEPRKVDYDPVDDGWGPPGTTIPPPLLGAIPGTDERQSGIIPLPSIDDAPLMVAPPQPPEPQRGAPAEPTQQGLLRELEDATMRVLDLIRTLERAVERDDVVAAMISHLAETHRRAGFFASGAGELRLFAMSPRPHTMPAATLRLDRPSTLQDVVGTRLPYRGPTTDDASRSFLTSVLGACPTEILLVPVVVRERVVGILFGEQRQRHTFDDQLAIAARAAGMALERILKAKRS